MIMRCIAKNHFTLIAASTLINCDQNKCLSNAAGHKLEHKAGMSRMGDTITIFTTVRYLHLHQHCGKSSGCVGCVGAAESSSEAQAMAGHPVGTRHTGS